MIQGLYTAAEGIVALQARQEIVANNVANIATPGFKRQAPVQLGYYELFTGKLRHSAFYQAQSAPGGGVKFLESYPDMRPGMLVNSGSDLTAGLQGPGFFVVNTPAGERYTRSGDFMIDSDGFLATPGGYRVQTVDGADIPVGTGRVEIATDGQINVDGEPVGTIRLIEVDEPERMVRVGESLYEMSDAVARTMRPATETAIEQSMLEMSNVNPSIEVAVMMSGLRAYEANQRAIRAMDESLNRLIDQVGMP